MERGKKHCVVEERYDHESPNQYGPVIVFWEAIVG